MTSLLPLLLLIGVLLAVDLLALHSGVDSRDGLDDSPPHPLR